jgi:hypothetical protein
MQALVKKRELAEARRALAALAARVPTVQVAAETGIHQSQVSRLFRGQFARMSTNVRKLLAYATERKPMPEPPQAGKEAVVRAALNTWDTTPEGARALVRLLRSVRDLQAAPRRRRR